MNVNIKQLNPLAIPPAYATDGSGCFDIFACMPKNERVDMLWKGQHIFETGWSFEIPKGYVMLLFSRSGHGFDYDTRLANCVGVIDSDYRGEVKVKLTQDHRHYDPKLYIRHGVAIAQGLIVPIPTIRFNVVDELSTTERGTNGFGSTDNILLKKQAG